MADTITAADRATLPIFDAEELTKAAVKTLANVAHFADDWSAKLGKT